MLGESYFSLVQALHECRSFEEVADLLSQKLPGHLKDDHATIALLAPGPELLGIYGSGPSSQAGREEFGRVAALLPKHPLISRVDFTNPGSLGFTVSDYLEPGDYRKSEFNVGLPEAMQAEDSMAGGIMVGWGRISLLFVCRDEGQFTKEDREIFDAVLFTARAVVERIAGGNMEKRFREYILGKSGPLALFSLRTNREILPINFLSIRHSESWWGQDEAFRELDERSYQQVVEVMDGAWEDPAVARFARVELDLGSGPMAFHGLPKPDGEILLVLAESSEKSAKEDAVNAVLTKRQREIMEWIAEGKTSAEAAIILEISPRTVEKHLEAVFQRLGVENRIAAVRRFLDLKQGQPV
ncbi:response regulator transcription factor [Haloferula sp.]|uniref:helix-turn-helix transcriptional regulator n=1 Tax=Haloferula sp. TaxID=2497595 RepID=UPI00329C12D4